MLAVLAVLGAVAFVQWGGVAFDTDVRAIYAATLGVRHGISPWDELGQAALLSETLGEPRAVLPFGYPPWYVLLTLPMGWLDYPRAERLFIVLNLAWFALGTWLLTVDDEGELDGRLATLVGTYPPLIGLIAIGQMAMPVFAGAALALYAHRRRQPWLLAIAALLLSFKWHIGALPGLFFLAALWRDRELFWRTLPRLGAVFAVASTLGLLLDPRWPLTYARSVLDLSGADVNQVCDTCSSLAWTGTSWTGWPTSLFALPILALGTAAMAWRLSPSDARGWLAAGTALTLMSLPYSRNYDDAMLAIPLAIAFERARSSGERALIVACSIATLALILLPRTAADELLGGSALVLFVLLLARAAERPRPAG